MAVEYMTRGTKRMTGSSQGVDYLYDPMHRISRSREKCMWTNRPVEGALVNSHFPGAIAWSDGDLNPGLDQERRVRTRTGGFRISEIGGLVGSRHSLL